MHRSKKNHCQIYSVFDCWFKTACAWRYICLQLLYGFLNLFQMVSLSRLTKVSGISTAFGYPGSGLSSRLRSVLTQRCEPWLRCLSKPLHNLHQDCSSHCSHAFAQPHGIAEEYELERKSAKLCLSCLMSGQRCSLQDNFWISSPWFEISQGMVCWLLPLGNISSTPSFLLLEIHFVVYLR